MHTMGRSPLENKRLDEKDPAMLLRARKCAWSTHSEPEYLCTLRGSSERQHTHPQLLQSHQFSSVSHCYSCTKPVHPNSPSAESRDRNTTRPRVTAQGRFTWWELTHPLYRASPVVGLCTCTRAPSCSRGLHWHIAALQRCCTWCCQWREGWSACDPPWSG